MIQALSLAQHTLYADLLEQGSDDLFDPDLPENGSILIRGNRAGAPADHAYYQGYRPAASLSSQGQRYARYLGRADDPAVAQKLARFRTVKEIRAERTSTVRALVGAGMKRPDRITGQIIEAIARKALFHDQAVLLGDAACQTYEGALGVRFAKGRPALPDHRPSVALVVRDGKRLGRLLDALQTIDASFAAEPSSATTYRAVSGVRITTIAENGGDTQSALVSFLMDRPIAALVLHGPGIPVLVPAPERYLAYVRLRPDTSHPALVADLGDALTLMGRHRALTEALQNAGAVLAQ